MRSDKRSQMRVFYVGLIVEGVNEDITPGQELEEEIRQQGGEGGGGWREVDYEGPMALEVFCQRRPRDLQKHCRHDLGIKTYVRTDVTI